jgi:hypothetical protein
MSQNGSDFLSDRGWNYVDILRFYYGADIRLVVAATPDTGTLLAGPKTLADFELDEGYFRHEPGFSPTSQNLFFGAGGSTADRVTTLTHAGQACQRIDLKYDPASGQDFFYRHVGGSGPVGIATAVSNIAFEPVGSVGFWLLTETPGLKVCVAVDDMLGGDRGLPRDVIPDGQWHFYQWFLDNPLDWQGWDSGDGAISGLTSIDSIQVFGRSDATLYVDDVIYNPRAVLVDGDVDGDGHVDVVDLLYFVDTFGLVLGDPGFDSRCDFNADGSVDVVDLLSLVENFGL